MNKAYRELDKRFKLKKHYIISLIEAENRKLILPLPEDIVKAYHIEENDFALFEIINKKCIIIRFLKNTMYGRVKKWDYLTQ